MKLRKKCSPPADFVYFNVSSLKNQKTYDSQFIESTIFVKADTLDMRLNKELA